MLILLFLILLLCTALYWIMVYFKDSHPLLDSITTGLSIGGMYLTVRRAIEQWIFWLIVNLFSLFMWISVAFSGAKVYSTIAMWGVYVFLAIYFYLQWKKEINSKEI